MRHVAAAGGAPAAAGGWPLAAASLPAHAVDTENKIRKGAGSVGFLHVFKQPGVVWSLKVAQVAVVRSINRERDNRLIYSAIANFIRNLQVVFSFSVRSKRTLAIDTDIDYLSSLQLLTLMPNLAKRNRKQLLITLCHTRASVVPIWRFVLLGLNRVFQKV